MKIKYYLSFVTLLFASSIFSQEKLDVFFDFNIDIPNQKSLVFFQNWIDKNPNIEVVRAYGYCDSVDDKSYNKELALRRVQNVLKLLQEKNIQVSKTVEEKAIGKEFNQSSIQEENRKVSIWYIPLKPNKNTTPNLEIPSIGDLNLKIESEKKLLSSKFNSAKKGDKITIQNIYFYWNSDKIITQSIPILEELATILKNNPKLKIQIQGHICCNTDTSEVKLSLQRAIKIKSYLLEKEILFNRLSSVGFGSSKPIFAIPEKSETEKLANRRVEILIVDK